MADLQVGQVWGFGDAVMFSSLIAVLKVFLKAVLQVVLLLILK